MAGNWISQQLGELFTLHPGFAFRSQDFVPSGVPVLKIKNIKANGLTLDDLSFVDESFLKTRRSYLVRDGDILITLSGNRFDGSMETWVGKVAHFREVGNYLLNQRVAVLRPKPGATVDNRCCAYILSSEPYQQLFIAIATSSGGQANLSSAQVLSAKILIPPLNEQQAIASLLGALDDKIELNRRMNRTLEGIARAVFKSWFVDFDPVRAKARVRREHPDWSDAQLNRTACPHLKPALAALFPDALQDSELGEIPKGWKVRELPEVCEINPSRALARGEIAPYLDMSNMPTQGPSPDSWVLREAGSGMKFTNGDTLVARITPCLENGKTAFVDFLADGQVGWGSTEYIVLRPKGAIPPTFAYLMARTEEFRSFAIQRMTGSSGRQRVPADSLAKYLLVAPELSSKLFGQLGELVSPIFSRIRSAMAQSRTIAALRDALLPKLISGELRLPDAERIVGRAM